MKGPYERLKYSLRRVWECPVCNHRERTDGETTSCYCRCQGETATPQQACMKLIQDGLRRTNGPDGSH